MGNKRFIDTYDLHRHGCVMVVECRACGHKAEFSSRQLQELARRRTTRLYLGTRMLGSLVRRMRCGECGANRVTWWPREIDR